jgi:hypothetical protein
MLSLNNHFGRTFFNPSNLRSVIGAIGPAQIQQAMWAAQQALQAGGMGQTYSGFHSPCGCLPRPRVGLSGAPAGRGLAKDPEGFPAGAVRTAGGYTVVPEGNTAWRIYSPGQRHSDKANTRVWGDPHVDEKDGTRWDFTRSSDFVLPDGTRIFAQTTSETGQSITKALTITNGADRIAIDGINGSPSTGAITHDGYEWRAQHLSTGSDRDTFRLGGDDDAVSWFKERAGQQLGEVTGARYDGAGKQYVQNLDYSKPYWASGALRPALGSPAWGNALRGQLTDVLSGQMDPWSADLFAGSVHRDHLRNQTFGGLLGLFDGYGSVFGALGRLRHHMLDHGAMAQSLMSGRLMGLYA